MITIGMAAYSDYPGVWSTLRSIKLHHPEVKTIVIETSPALGTQTRDVARSTGEYLHRPDLKGTAAPRAEIFAQAKTDWVIVCDCHVLFADGAIQAAIDYADANPFSNDLILGPVIFGDTLSSMWRPTTPMGLWGTWHDGVFIKGCDFVLGYPEKGMAKFVDFHGNLFDTDLQGAEWTAGLIEEMKRRGWKHRRSGDGDPRPFPVPMSGLGVFMMRRGAFPGFNPLHRDFGGEEGYLAEKVRQAGGKVLCLPGLRWDHRWRGSEDACKYPITCRSHAWNLTTGAALLGFPVDPIKQHGDAATVADLDSLIAEAVAAAGAIKTAAVATTPPSMPVNVQDHRRRIRVAGIWYSNNSAPDGLLLASLNSISKSISSYHECKIITCPWVPISGNPLPQIKAEFTDKPAHENIVLQQRLCIESLWPWKPELVLFLEHDVLYPEDYFDRMADLYASNPWAQVVSNLDYIGMNENGWLDVRERHEPLHQIGMSFPLFKTNTARVLADCEKQGWSYLEPDHNQPRSRWARFSAESGRPSVHVNHKDGRLTSHGEVVYDPISKTTVHPYWGQHNQYWFTKYKS